MKTMKKTLVIITALAMLFTLAIPAFAVESPYTITINNSNDGHTYGAYQIFSGSISSGVLVDIEWGAAIEDSDALLALIKAGTYETLDFTGAESALDVATDLKVDGIGTDDLNAFAKIVGTYLVDNDVAATQTATYNTTNYTVEVDTGYYLVKDDASVSGSDSATLYMLDVAQDVTMTPKSDVPSVVKKVLEDTDVTDYTVNDEDYNDVADWDIGQTKSFRLYGTIPENFEELANYETYRFIFHDSYDEGITVSESLVYSVAYVVGETVTELDSSTFTVVQDQEANTITFTCDDLKAVLGDDIYNNPTVVITYDAMLNEDADIGLDGNENEVYLEFSNDPYNSSSTGILSSESEGNDDEEIHETGETEKDVVIVFTYALSANKVDSETNDALAGAEFILKNADGEYAVVLNGYFQEWTADEADATTLVSDENGDFEVIGLDADTYFLKETQAPDGYNMLQNEIELTITSDNSGEVIYQQSWDTFVATDALTDIELTVDGATTAATDGTVSLTIENSQGVTLPETGGIGTTIFYIVGATLVLGAGIILITKKRMASQG